MPSASCRILGISAFYHDSAAALVVDGDIVAAAQEERFTRTKGDAAFPGRAVEYCLREGGLTLGDIDHVVFYDKPLLKFERILETYLSVAPKGFRSFLKAGPVWMKEKLYTDRMIREALDGFEGSVLYAEHHESHAASAFFPSPFEEAAILTVDGVGEWATTTMAVGRGNEITKLREIRWPDSLGLLYSAFTYYLGFKVNSGEYKVMGLAPYGEPKYLDLILSKLIDLREDGSFTLNQKYFGYLSGLTMTSPAFDELFSGPPRAPESLLTQREMDLARSIQAACEEIMLRMVRETHRVTGLDCLCLAGGVALNAVANGRIIREGPFRSVWIQPASGDAGGALGAALLAWHRHTGGSRAAVGTSDSMKGALLGPEYGDQEIEEALDRHDAVYDRFAPAELNERVAALLADGKVVGWFAGRMEFGPRALGARSILADARNPAMQSQLNLKIKFREGFRPFAPSVLKERAAQYFELDGESPYMLVVAPVAEARRLPRSPEAEHRWGIERLNLPRSDVPAVTHVDYSARLQTVDEKSNPPFRMLLEAFERQTGCPVLVNTSFNVRGEPIVCTPDDAYRCFMRTDIDYLVVWPYLLDRSRQPEWKEAEDWKSMLQPD